VASITSNGTRGRVGKRAPRKIARQSRVSSDPDYMLSLARGLSVLRAFGEGRTELSIADVARLTGLSRAAARRCLHTLSTLGYASGTNGTYELTPKILALGHAYLGSTPVARAAQPVLERVSEQLHESSSLAVLDGDEIVYVARAATRRILSIGLSVGSRLPADCTSMGRVLLAFLPDAERARYLARVKLVSHTPRTIVDKKALRAELDRIRAAGYALIDQELEQGLRSLAVPVRRHDHVVVAAVNVGVHAGRVDSKTLVREYLPVLQDASSEIGMAIGHALR
jgi:IclR family pca regulon transcriptional regulator